MVPLLVFWLWPYSGIVDNKYTEVRERHLLIANNLGAALETYHRDIVTTLDSFAAEIVAGAGEEARPLFDNLYFRHICVVDRASGRVTRSFLSETHPCPAQIDPARLARFQALSAGVRVGMSGVSIPDQGRPRIFAVTELGSSLVVGAIHTDFFRTLQKRIAFGRRGHAAIVDHTGRALAHPSAEWERVAFDMSNLSAVARMKLGETGVDTFFSPAMQASMIAGFTAVSGPGWGVMVPQPVSELEEAAQIFNRNALIILNIGLCLSLLLAWAVAGMFAARIHRVEQKIHDVGAAKDTIDKSVPRTFFRIREFFSLDQGVDQMAKATSQARRQTQAHTEELEHTNMVLRREIQERVDAEEQSKRSEARFRGLFDAAPVAIREEDLSGVKRAVDKLEISDPEVLQQYLDANPEFIERCGALIVVVDANRASLDLHGYTQKSDMLTRVTRQLSAASMDIVRQTITAIHAGKPTLSYEIPVYPITGEPRRVASSWMVLAGHEHTYRRILLTSLDVTERTKSVERIHKAQKMEAVGQLTGGIAHDFNNLLTVIGGNVDLIQENMTNAQDYLHPIKRAVMQGSELTQRLLAFSRQQPLAPRVVDLNDLLRDMESLLNRTLGEDVVIDFQYDLNSWPVLADPNQVENALLNLGLNGRDAMPQGGTLSVMCQNRTVAGWDSDDLVDGDYVVLSVSDTGKGMTNDELSHAFEPFFTTKAVGKGSGLGLSMVYGFAKQSKGHAEIVRRAEAGTTVRVYLPRAQVMPEAPSQPVIAPDTPKGAGQRILVLEDQDDVRIYLGQLLELMGYHPLTASNARQARQILDATKDVRVALCDVMLPGGMSGAEFANQAMQLDPELHVIFMSGYPAADLKADPYQLGTTVLLTKPFDSKRLALLLRAAFEAPKAVAEQPIYETR
ncbi:MAG: ATP-binding protein [Paracoccaceae bacterium]